MKNKEILFEIVKDIEDFKNVKLEIEYSHGNNDNELEFECVRVSEENDFNDDVIEEIEDILECGFESFILSDLSEYYKDSNIVFIYDEPCI